MQAGALLWVAAAGCEAVRAASIEWGTRGAFETCLDAQTKEWVRARGELVLNEDPAASDIDDPAVAAWTAQALSGCAAKAGRGDGASEQLFARYMAHWREHIDTAVKEARRRSPPD
jgi:hypothetical protein